MPHHTKWIYSLSSSNCNDPYIKSQCLGIYFTGSHSLICSYNISWVSASQESIETSKNTRSLRKQLRMKLSCLVATVLMMFLLCMHLHQLECRVLVSSATAINGRYESSEISAKKASTSSSKFQSSSLKGKIHKHRGNQQGMFTLASGPYGKGIGH